MPRLAGGGCEEKCQVDADCHFVDKQEPSFWSAELEGRDSEDFFKAPAYVQTFLTQAVYIQSPGWQANRGFKFWGL